MLDRLTRFSLLPALLELLPAVLLAATLRRRMSWLLEKPLVGGVEGMAEDFVMLLTQEVSMAEYQKLSCDGCELETRNAGRFSLPRGTCSSRVARSGAWFYTVWPVSDCFDSADRDATCDDEVKAAGR